MVQITQRLAPPLATLPPRFHGGLLRLAQAALPLLLRLRLRPWLPAGISAITVHNALTLAHLYHQFQRGEGRFMVAFRHGEVDDPLCVAHLFSRTLPRVARSAGIPLTPPFHVHGLYDRGMTLWGGRWLGWFLSHLGAIAIHRGKRRDLEGIRTARLYGRSGQFPLAIAPEGATNGHSGRVSPLEPGAAQLGFWCAEDLAKGGTPQPVWILPLGIQYRYPHPPWRRIDRLLARLEQDCGLVPTLPIAPGFPDGENWPDRLWPRLLALGDHLLGQVETFYGRCYPQIFTPLVPDRHLPLATQLEKRLHHWQDGALRVAEQHFDLKSEGTIIDRCRRLEEAGWQQIYRSDLPPLDQLNPVDRGLGDWLAQESALHLHHMRLVESFVAVTADYIPQDPSPERFAEMALLLLDGVERLKGRKMPARPRLGWREAVLTLGDPINVSDRLPDYLSHRTAAKAAIAQLTTDLQQSLEALLPGSSPAGYKD
ncbi:lysophospholipid acyltransferase family protein [Prochlorothrix hollandica]|uniref:Glycerol acyltransferase n=1 Tax=Prochlorothrix hollandica PCC 9006 = CALU 1027 TaxID=317619 RepID=A0A0M2PZC7_PROHO|nr:1-acyl-sn-glycerol-3-phosphate acyltransferase [Prochlorothrix hollandica]KKJ01505.1 glycerol acyltransferase [Prochlorothrix hollandica PCC 9006 = CALU 1027]